MDIKTLHEVGENLFSHRTSLLSLWQEIADNFYPERADFTTHRHIGEEFADNLTTSYPVLIRRDLGNSLQTMLRPTEKTWFHLSTSGDERLGIDAKRWMQWAEDLQRKAMYDRKTQFSRAVREADHDFATFGQCVISIELNKQANGLLYRTWHLRDVAWSENEEGGIGCIFRRWKPKLHDLIRIFGRERVHPEHLRRFEKSPFDEANVKHMVVAADLLDGRQTHPYVSIFFDTDHQQVIEQRGVFSHIYIIPRWQTVSGSQYSYSPATVAGLPDARLLQAMTYTLLEAGEKSVNPPLVAVQEAIRSDVGLYAGGVTWVDAAYDERLGEVLRPISQDYSKIPFGVDIARDVRFQLAEAFYLNKLTLPQRAPEMTAYEVSQRIQQYIREALPLFEPMETEYNGALCEETFNTMLRAGAFGSPFDMPDELRGRELTFKFQSPLHDAIEREKGATYMEGQGFVASTMQIDPNAVHIMDTTKALRDVLNSIRVPARWMRSEDEVKARVQQQEAQVQAAQNAAVMQQGAEAALSLTEVGQQFQAPVV